MSEALELIGILAGVIIGYLILVYLILGAMGGDI
jgi:hypothetical protein